jgi:hypothetical protein
LWADGAKIKKPVKVSASEYADLLFTWVQGIFEDEAIFPVNEDEPFPDNFSSIMKNVFKRLFRYDISWCIYELTTLLESMRTHTTATRKRSSTWEWKLI